MRRHSRVLLTPFLAAAIAACTDRIDPASPAVPTHGPTPGLDPATASVALLMFEVRGEGLESPLRYDLLLADGRTERPLPMPEGGGYEVGVRAYDTEGRETHAGTVGIETVGREKEHALHLALEPVADGMGRLELDLAVRGEPRLAEGHRVAIATDVLPIDPGKPFQLRGRVIDEAGKDIDVDPSMFHWFIDDSRIDLLAPTRPPDESDVSFVMKYADELNPTINVGVVVGTSLQTVRIPLYRLGPYVDVSAGGSSTCAVRSDGEVDCWGSDASEQLRNDRGLFSATMTSHCADLGAGHTGFFSCVPGPVIGGDGFAAVSVGGLHACATLKYHGMQNTPPWPLCWGDNGDGQVLFRDPANPAWTPVRYPWPARDPSGGDIEVQMISAGGRVSCAVTTTDQVVCWGLGLGQAQLNLGTHEFTTWTSRYKAVVAGGDYACALRLNGSHECHGNNPDPGYPIHLVSIGQGRGRHLCGITTSPTVMCWGANTFGQLGRGTSGGTLSAESIMIAGQYFRADFVTTGEAHSCALRSGVPYCWGRNHVGQLGVGSGFGSIWTPTRVAGGVVFTKISAGSNHTCGLTEFGLVLCWGENGSKLGIGTFGPASVSTPTLVARRP